jgi:hypothetical protein
LGGEGAEWVVREGVGGEMNQALYAHMNNKRKMKKKKRKTSHTKIIKIFTQVFLPHSIVSIFTVMM